jgi:molybdopterin-guanine dinucleotide biosynthesis protein A
MTSQLNLAPLVGVLIGGRGTRMGGRDKSRLPAPDTGEALAARIVRLASELGLSSVLIGGEPLPPSAHVLDDPEGIGPIGGLCALFEAARARPALAVACDMPHVTAALLERLWREQPSACVLAPRDPETGKWQPLFARYEPGRVLPVFRAAIARGVRSMQTALRELPVVELSLSEAERSALRDWDLPSDVQA